MTDEAFASIPCRETTGPHSRDYARILAALRILTAGGRAVPLGSPSDAEVRQFIAIIEQCGGCRRDAAEGTVLARKLAEDFNHGLVRLL